VAAPLAEASYKRGDEIAGVGETARSMLVVLEGAVDLESKVGAKVGRLTTDGVIGEAEVLGLLDKRLISARAAAPCRVLTVTGEAMSNALAGPHAGAMKAGLERLVASRREQLEGGMPLCALSVGASPDDPSVRAAGLHAERMYFEPGQCWEPLPDSDACGPNIGIFVKGRGTLVIGTDDREVMTIQPGTLLLEGLLAEFDARVQILSSDCEAYRVRRIELEAAARSGSQSGKVRSAAQEAADWFYQFRLLEKEVRTKLHERLSSAKGLAAIRVPHPCDPCINDWSQRRRRSLRRAEQIRQERADALGSGKPPLLQLPLLPTQDMGSTAHRHWGPSIERRKSAGSVGKAPLPALPRSLAVYPVMRLPKVHSEPQLRRPRSREQVAARR